MIAFTAAIGIDEKRPKAFVGRGDAYLALAADDPAQYLGLAAADYETALGLDGSDPAVYERLADVYIQQGETEKAKDILQSGIDATGDAGLQERLDDLVAETGGENDAEASDDTDTPDDADAPAGGEATNTGNAWPGGEIPPVPDDGIERTVIEVATGEELEALAYSGQDLSNTEIHLTGDIYRCESLWFSNYDNLSIIGNGRTSLYSAMDWDIVLGADACNNFLLYGLRIGYEAEDGQASVLSLSADTGMMRVIACELFGGAVGMETSGQMLVQHCTIRDCTQGALQAFGNDVQLDHCTISANGQGSPEEMLYLLSDSHVALTDCLMRDNFNTIKYGEYLVDEAAGDFYVGMGKNAGYTETDCTEEGNAWQ